MTNEAILEAVQAMKSASHEMAIIKMAEALIEALTPEFIEVFDIPAEAVPAKE